MYLSHEVCKESSANLEEFYTCMYKLSFQKGRTGTGNYVFCLAKTVDFKVILHKTLSPCSCKSIMLFFRLFYGWELLVNQISGCRHKGGMQWAFDVTEIHWSWNNLFWSTKFLQGSSKRHKDLRATYWSKYWVTIYLAMITWTAEKYRVGKNLLTSYNRGKNRKRFAYMYSQLLLFEQINKWIPCCIFYALGGQSAQRRFTIISVSLASVEGAEKQPQQSLWKVVFLCLPLPPGWWNNTVWFTGFCRMTRWYPKIRWAGHLSASAVDHTLVMRWNQKRCLLEIFLGLLWSAVQPHFCQKAKKVEARHVLKANKRLWLPEDATLPVLYQTDANLSYIHGVVHSRYLGRYFVMVKRVPSPWTPRVKRFRHYHYLLS